MCALHPPHPPPRVPRAWDRVGTRHAFISRLTPHISPQRPLARSTVHHGPGCPRPVLGSGLELQRLAWVAGRGRPEDDVS